MAAQLGGSDEIVGEVVACVDLTKIRAEDIYTNGDSVHLVLPIPEICHYKVDHSKSKVYDVEFGLWQTAELVDGAYADAEKQLYAEALRMGIAQQSRENAIKVLSPILGGLGFKHINITFKTSIQTNSEFRKYKID